jgi:hypothetical protein
MRYFDVVEAAIAKRGRLDEPVDRAHLAVNHRSQLIRTNLGDGLVGGQHYGKSISSLPKTLKCRR